MTTSTNFVKELEEHIDALSGFYENSVAEGPVARIHKRLAAVCKELANSADAGEFGRAASHVKMIRRISIDGLSLNDEWLTPLSRLEKVLTILETNARCPHCNGLLRSARAKQCPECLRDWHDADNVKPLG